LLSYLYPFIDTRQLHHVDHVFPRSQLKRQRLIKIGLDSPTIAEARSARNRLANLQLLEGALNQSKSNEFPAEWLKAAYPNRKEREATVARHDLGELPESAREFLAFYNARRAKLQERLTTMLAPGMAEA
jgi:5-methylcytosine-specific restriction endonuclease McrA